MTRREISFLVLGLSAGAIATVFAQANGQEKLKAALLPSGVYTWASLPVEKTANGERRAIFDATTATVDRLETHVTTIDAGKASHAAHRHPDEELVFVREGVVEATINGVATKAPAGSVIFYASNDLHGMRNAGEGRGELLRASLDVARQGRTQARRIAVNEPAAAQAAPGLSRRMLIIMCAAAAVLMVTMGMRQSLGLYIAPIIESTHVGYAAMSFALAVGQLMWGVAQPVFGALADRHGSRPVLIAGALLLAGGTALTPFASGEFTLLLTIGVLTAAGAGAGSFSVLIGVVAQRVPAAQALVRLGLRQRGRQPRAVRVRAAQPVADRQLRLDGARCGAWRVAALATIPHRADRCSRRRGADDARAAGTGGPAPSALSLREQLAIASRDRSYWCLHAGFFTCGFHISFLVTHLPGEVKLCSLPASVAAGSLAIIGLANVAGSLMAGWAGGVMRMKWLLFAMYFSRAVAVALYLAAPKTAAHVLSIRRRAGLHLARHRAADRRAHRQVVRRALSRDLVRPRHVHAPDRRILRRVARRHRALTAFGDFSWMWYADIALALAAAFINLPIREAPSYERRQRAPFPKWPSGLRKSDPISGADQAIHRARGGAVREHRAVERAGWHTEVIAQHALHDGAQVARGFEVACIEQIRARKARPVGDARVRPRPRRLTGTRRRPCRDPCRACR